MSADLAIISGATGHVGRFIALDLAAHGHPVRLLSRRRPAKSDPLGAFDFVEGALDPARDQQPAFAGASIFVHAAFDHLPGRYRGGEGDDPEGFRRRNVDGSVALFEAARRAGVGHIVFLSSRAVYGPHPAGATLSEEAALLPDTLYGVVKRECETALSAIEGGGLATTALRITGVYGHAYPGAPDKWQELVAAHLHGKPTEPRAGTEVHGSDVAGAVRLVLPRAGGAEIFNASDLPVDRADLLAEVNRIAGRDLALPPRAAAPENPMDCTKLASLGWKPGGKARLRLSIAALVDAVTRGEATKNPA